MSEKQLSQRERINLAVQEALNISKNDAKLATATVLETIRDLLIAEDRVALKELGTLLKTHRSERSGRNPQTGEAIQIPASTSARFKPNKALKELLK